MLIFGDIITFVTLLLISLAFFARLFKVQESLTAVVIIVNLYLYMANFALTWGSLTWVLIAELSPENFTPFAAACNWFGSVVTMIGFPIVISYLP